MQDNPDGLYAPISRRDYFAAQALAGLGIPIGSREGHFSFNWGDVAWSAYQVADAMLTERGHSSGVEQSPRKRQDPGFESRVPAPPPATDSGGTAAPATPAGQCCTVASIANALVDAPRQGLALDTPEGVRFITISDTLAVNWARTLYAAANALDVAARLAARSRETGAPCVHHWLYLGGSVSHADWKCQACGKIKVTP